MKITNVKYIVDVFKGDKEIKTRYFVSEHAKDNFCNRQYKMGDPTTYDVVCKVYSFETLNLIETWAA